MATPTVGRSALAKVNLVVSQGADNVYSFRYLAGDPATPVDMTGWTGHSQIRAQVGGTVYTELDVDLDNDGNVTVTLAHAVTEDPAWNRYSAGVWDLELTDVSGNIVRFVEGTVKIVPDVTRE